MSAKKMHPPAMVQTPIGPIASKSNALVVNGGGKVTKDRQNAENIVPASLQNGPGEQINGIKKLSNKAPPVVAAVMTPTVVSSSLIKTVQSHMNGSSVISTLNSTNRRKSHRLNSPNRKRREQQNVFNSLRSWDVKIVPSGQTVSQEDRGKNEKQSAAQVIGSSSNSSNEASKANSERSSSASSITTSGSMSSSVSSNTSSSSCSISSSSSSSISDNINDNGLSKGKKRLTVATIVPSKEPSTASVAIAQNVKKKEEAGNRVNASNEGKPILNAPAVQPVLAISNTNGHSAVQGKVDRKLLNGSGGFSANHRHPAAVISPSHSSSSGSVIPSSSSSSSTVVASLPSSASSITRSSLTPPVMSTSSPAVLTSSPTNHSRHNSGANTRASNAGKVLLPNVNPLSGTPLDPMTLLQGKLRGTMIGPQQQPLHHISHHHSNHSNLPGQSHQQQQHNGQQMQPTTPPHYSLDFLHSVGMRMFTTTGTSQTTNAASSTAASALLRGNPHFNYNNFNQQLHQQQQHLIHQQHQQQHQQQQPFHQMQRHYSNIYNCDDLLLQTGSAGEPIYPNYPVSDHMVGGGGGGSGAGSGAVGSNANDNGMAYCYSQNHQHHHQQQHNHSSHHHQQQQQPQHHHHHQQSSYGNGGSYHQNNNYQQHNRNYGRTGPGSNLQNGGGKKTWNNNWHNSKKPVQGKYGNKGTGYNHGYRKSYHYYHNSHYGGGGHHYDQNQNQQSESLRNLIYIKGYNYGQGAPESHGSFSRSPTPSPQSSSPPIEATEASQTIVPNKTGLLDEPSDSGIEETGSTHKKSSTVPSSSSSSSSMVSIPSTDSSTISASAAHNLSLELHCANGQGYESDSSHSSSYNSHTYRHRKYANSGQVYRSSSSTSSGVSSTATFPPLNPDYHLSVQPMIGSANNTPTAMNAQITDFFLRSQSYHGSHQNLTAVSASTSPHPPNSPVNTPRSIVGTQSMPMFSELFTGKQPQHHSQQQKQQRSQPSSHYGSDNSLELTLPTGGECSGATSVGSNNSSITSNCGSSGYASAPASTVPPNENHSMQSGHPKKRYSGRSSPAPYVASANQKPNLPTTSTSSNPTVSSSQQLSPIAPGRKVQSTAWSKPSTTNEPPVSPTASVAVPPPSLSPGINGSFMYPFDGINMHTPADRFLARAHLVELREPPVELAPCGSKWASLSTAVWDKFAAAQQTEEKFTQKIHLWRYLFMCIRVAFPRLSLYMVGSSISGFASDSSDVDMCLVCRSNTVPFDMRGEALFQLGQLKNYFMNINTHFEEFSVIQAKVPILRFRETAHSTVIDLNFNNSVGIRNTHLLFMYSQLDWRLRPLALVVKLWAQHHNINDAKNMTISSYSLVLMVIHFLQYGVSPPVLPCLHAMYPDKFVRMSDISTIDLMETIDPYSSDNHSTLGELFVQFLEYYANFDYAHYAISVRTASVIPIESARVARSYKNDPHHWRQLCIEEPFDLTNTARSVFDADIFEQIKSVFSTCWRRLKETNDLNSIFECEPLFIPVASALSITS